MPILWQRLRECIRNHIRCRTVFQLDIAIFNTFANEVILNVDVFDSCVIFGVVS